MAARGGLHTRWPVVRWGGGGGSPLVGWGGGDRWIGGGGWWRAMVCACGRGPRSEGAGVRAS